LFYKFHKITFCSIKFKRVADNKLGVYMSCSFEKCKECREYSKCPNLSAVLQRSYANRKLDGIYDKLSEIEKLLKILTGKS